ncbi:hypothetical protein A0H81_11438 [Grifola frondosa]|uniref:DUF6535 domain-containing protein n=1 Tax=Grifola frondosa TaxID=5627 RepID=A0A1C7LUW0_GRIFR|nr:hypothetical protein A0H81_11438 [Grifola frondosa]
MVKSYMVEPFLVSPPSSLRSVQTCQDSEPKMMEEGRTHEQLNDIAEQLRQEDDAVIKPWMDQMDNLLVFAASAVVLNVLWFASLTCSLLSAAICILAKEWLREYAIEYPSELGERVRIMKFRRNALRRWHVSEVVGSSSLLLQFAVGFFKAGTLCFVWKLNTAVAIVVTIVIGIWTLLWLVVAIIPTFRADCPYKSPSHASFSCSSTADPACCYGFAGESMTT